MEPTIQMVLAASVSVSCSLAVLRALSSPLSKVLLRICPDEPAAAFWLRYSQLMLTIAPLLVVLLVDMFAASGPPLALLRGTLVASLLGLLGGLAAIGWELGQFVRPPREGSRA